MRLDITIPTYSTVESEAGGSKPYTSYAVTVKGPLRTTTVQKRYTDFEELHRALTAAAGGQPPPQSLPGKSWLSLSRTVNNPSLAEERRQGLERYVRAIEGADDGRWRGSRIWRDFLGLSLAAGGNDIASRGFGSVRGGSGVSGQIATATGWLDAHVQLKSQLHEARIALNRREQAREPSQQHEAGAAAKKCLVRSGTLIAQLDDGLRRLSGGKSRHGEDAWTEKLGEGEIRRRRDLLSAARKEREGLEVVLNTLAVKSALASAAENSVQGRQAANNANPVLAGQGARPGRVLGAPAKETERTRELDNQGVLQLQQQIMKEQDMDLDDLTKVVMRMREIGVQINEELEEQATMLDLVDQDATRVQDKVDIAKRRIKKIS